MSSIARTGEFDVPPLQDRYLEDYQEGTSYEFGSVTVSEEEVIEFARRYDPQPFHVDPDAVRRGRDRAGRCDRSCAAYTG